MTRLLALAILAGAELYFFPMLAMTQSAASQNVSFHTLRFQHPLPRRSAPNRCLTQAKDAAPSAPASTVNSPVLAPFVRPGPLRLTESGALRRYWLDTLPRISVLRGERTRQFPLADLFRQSNGGPNECRDAGQRRFIGAAALCLP